MAPDEAAIRLGEVNRLLDSPVMNEAFAAIERDAYEALLASTRDAGDEHIHTIRAIRALRQKLTLFASVAKQAMRTPPKVA